jgi:hypothetical protein
VDDTVKLKALIVANLATSQNSIKTLYFPAGKHLISDTLRPVTETQGGFDLNLQGDSRESTTITCNINKAVIDVSGNGGAEYDFRQPGFIKDLQIINQSIEPLAYAIKVGYTGRFLAQDLNILVNNIGIAGGEVITATFNRVNISPENIFQNLSRLKIGYDVFARNTNWNGGYVNSCDICFRAGGDDCSFYGIDSEYGRCNFQLTAAGTFNIVNSHFETTQLFLTNAYTIPFPSLDTVSWTDNSSQGSGSAGSVNISGCSIFNGYTVTNSIVIKSSPAFIYTVNITGCDFQGQNSLICGSFSPLQLTPLPSSTRLTIHSTLGLSYAKPPIDIYSVFSKLNCSGSDEIDRLIVNQLNLGSESTPIASTSTPTKKIPVYIQCTLYYLLAE